MLSNRKGRVKEEGRKHFLLPYKRVSAPLHVEMLHPSREGISIVPHCMWRCCIPAERALALFLLLVTKSCLILCSPMDCSPLGSSVHGISQARIVEWVAISFSGDLPKPGTKPSSPAWQQVPYQ